MNRLRGWKTREYGEHDSNQAAIDLVLDDHLASRAEYDEDMIDLRFQFTDQLSRDE